MTQQLQKSPSLVRLSVATAVVILIVIAVWKFIDFRMQPPPPPPDTEEAKG